ncbi:flavohemoprotein [Roseovarius sp. A-2]|uniref:2Fe-2S iron-sulfur cluster-binding protein n=1 Tax=Roseovarius sp. A-2 TaxID=1570360 RepID=UPI0009B56713|nr:2Fe-2S iron-sulfur cluster-binding protein [Roseovarius sp. A-2]GAW35820.1 flavohemoprotein [Roseovarius sp. A-2]
MVVGFREFRVADKVAESDIITSFYLEPTDGAPVWEVKPGQYLTLRMPGDGDPVLKTYSVSCDPSETRHHRITVKREAGLNGAPDGVGSCWLHDQVEVGQIIDIAAPRGAFVLDESSNRPVLLLSGGVGLTPMVSMLHRLRDSGRDVYFLHACENGRVHALRDEVLACVNDRIRARFVYRTPDEADRAAQSFDAQGVIDKAFLQNNLPVDDYEVYLCGPTPFMVAMYQLLQDVGVPKGRIAYEFFGKAKSLDQLLVKPDIRKAASRAAPTIQALTFLTDPDAWAAADEGAKHTGTPSQGEVTFRKSNTSAEWDGFAGSLLELAENAGLNPEFSCRSGICNSCKCTLVSGTVEYFEEPLIQPEEGQVLICCSRPKGAVVLDI